jgi:hypothetical protein
VSVIGIVLLAAAVVLLALAEWPRITRRAGIDVERRTPRRRKPARARHLRVVEPDSDPDEFQRAVERDLANLPTYDPRAKRD